MNIPPPPINALVSVKYKGNFFKIFLFHRISEKLTVTLSCSSLVKVNEGDNFTCVCRGEGGNPPADVTWFKDGVQIGETGKEEQTLTLSNVSKTASGIYNCAAESNTLTEKSIEIIFYCK